MYRLRGTTRSMMYPTREESVYLFGIGVNFEYISVLKKQKYLY